MVKPEDMMKIFVLSIATMLTCFTTKAALKLPAIFCDNMILQRETPLRIWGKSVAGASVLVTLNKQSTEVITDKNGNWQTTFQSMKAGGPYILNVSNKSSEHIILKNILIGDVWVCAGQSNMNFILSAEKNGSAALKDLQNNSIREFRCAMPSNVDNPENENHSLWLSATHENAALFSAIAYYFAKKIQSRIKVPIGLIVMACGNTRAESWTDVKSLRLYPSLQPLLNYWIKRRTNNQLFINHEPGYFYESVVKPVLPINIKGVLWYQGESNTLPDNSGRNINERAAEYKDLLKALINNWRKKFKQPKLPFYLIQLPNYKEPLQDLHWATIRQSQLDLSQTMPNVGLVVTIDLGDSINIHPLNKQAVAERTACVVLNKEYNYRNIIGSAPFIKSIKIISNKIRIYFTSKYSILSGIHKHNLEGFEIADRTDPEIFFKAEASIQNNTVIVSCDKSCHPETVRYAWADNPVVSLYSNYRLPVSPFLINIFRLNH